MVLQQKGEVPSRGLQRTSWGTKLSGPPLLGLRRACQLRWLSGVPGRGRKGGASVPGSVPASRAASKSVSACLPRGTDCCLFLLGSSVIGLTFRNHFSFFGNFFSQYTHIPCNWWVWRTGKFPKKGKEISQMQTEVS